MRIIQICGVIGVAIGYFTGRMVDLKKTERAYINKFLTFLLKMESPIPLNQMRVTLLSQKKKNNQNCGITWINVLEW